MILRSHGLLTPVAGPIDAVRACVGVQTQYATSLPVGVAARTAKTKKDWDYKALQSGELIKSWTVRSTIHVHTPEDYGLMLEAFGEARRKRFVGWMAKHAAFSDSSLEAAEDRILEALATGPLTRQQIHEQVTEFKGMFMVGWGLDVMGLAYLGKIVLLTPQKGATQFKRIERPEKRWTTQEATIELMRRYFATHGPATLADCVYWAGMSASQAREAFKALRDELQSVEVEGFPGQRFILKGTEAPLAKPSGLRLLAKFDPLMMGFRDKTLFLPATVHKEVFRPAGQVEATVLENGKVTGTWRLARSGNRGTVIVHPISPKGSKNETKIERQLVGLKSALGLSEIDFSVER